MFGGLDVLQMWEKWRRVCYWLNSIKGSVNITVADSACISPKREECIILNTIIILCVAYVCCLSGLVMCSVKSSMPRGLIFNAKWLLTLMDNEHCTESHAVKKCNLTVHFHFQDFIFGCKITTHSENKDNSDWNVNSPVQVWFLTVAKYPWLVWYFFLFYWPQIPLMHELVKKRPHIIPKNCKNVHQSFHRYNRI